MNRKELAKLLAQKSALAGARSMPRTNPHIEHHAKMERQSAFREFGASELFCPNCKKAMPVREKLLLTLPSGDLYDYVCTTCGNSLGTKTG